MRDQDTQTMHEMTTEVEERAGADEVLELGDVCDTKGAFGGQADGHGGFYNP